ncbi:auxin-responsive protein IAA12-like isoform X2 [Apium graveolens]|uniref:auxin-responsive protein IAA12-like isoform X2 n=1 Tax=Apium graveolens TaxID=4045 RepID=UPI003D78F648
MENTLGLLENSGGGIGREVPSGGSTTGSMSTVDNLVFSSEVSSCYPDENNDSDELELGLGLSLGGGAAANKSLKPPSWARILTAKDLPCLVSKSSSSSSPTVPKASHKRIAADSVSPPNGASSQVVGWPPVRAYRMNSLNQAKLSITEDFSSIVDKSENAVVNKDNNSCNKQGNDTIDKGLSKVSLFVKVNMDGTAIGRKVDLSAHNCYETLARTLEDMFCRSTRNANTRSNMQGHNLMVEAGGSSKLLVGSSEYVLTYEDKEGDWMLVGDVPWREKGNSSIAIFFFEGPCKYMEECSYPLLVETFGSLGQKMTNICVLTFIF